MAVTSFTIGNLHVYAPDASLVELGRRVCLDCNRNAYFTAIHTDWHGWDTTCLHCGRSWCDGEWMALDFVPQSRQRSIDGAKRRWRSSKAKLKTQGENNAQQSDADWQSGSRP
jgi:hypothetical protein